MTIDERLSRLERSARRWRLACVVTAGLGAAGLLFAASGSPVSDVVKTHELQVVDAKDNVVATIGIEDGQPQLGLLRGDGKYAARLIVTKDGSTMLVLRPPSTKGGVLIATNDGASAVGLRDDKSKAESRMTVAGKAGTFSTTDADGKETAH